MTDAPALTLRRPRPARALISLVAMIDVLLILLVFFMVTSTYLDLDMIPAVSRDDTTAPQTQQQAALPTQVMIRIGADGVPVIQGQALTPEALADRLRTGLANDPNLSVMIMPTGVALTQALVSVMDTATSAGIRQVRVIRLEARP